MMKVSTNQKYYNVVEDAQVELKELSAWIPSKGSLRDIWNTTWARTERAMRELDSGSANTIDLSNQLSVITHAVGELRHEMDKKGADASEGVTLPQRSEAVALPAVREGSIQQAVVDELAKAAQGLLNLHLLIVEWNAMAKYNPDVQGLRTLAASINESSKRFAKMGELR